MNNLIVKIELITVMALLLIDQSHCLGPICTGSDNLGYPNNLFDFICGDICLDPLSTCYCSDSAFISQDRKICCTSAANQCYKDENGEYESV